MEQEQFNLLDFLKNKKTKKDKQDYEQLQKKTKAALLQKPKLNRENGFKNGMAIRNYSHVKK